MPAGDPIEELLAGTFVDPVTGELLRAESRSVVIAESLAGREVELVRGLGVGTRLALIFDANTYVALGERVERALAGAFTLHPILLPAPVHADADTIARVVAALPPVDGVIAIGSGTLNDISKMVALERGVPQAVFATAPSMNGYTSLSASITIGGVKRSVRAATATGAFFDLGVIAAAPARMIRAGLGDSICRPTAQADWLLSRFVLDRPYREAPFALLADDEPELFARAGDLVRGDLDAMRRLVRTLVLSGFGMTICGGSFPASQGEHLMSHYVEMMRPPELPERLHGEQIAVCALAMARLQDRILARDTAPALKASAIRKEDLIARYGAEAGEVCWAELEPKLLDEARAAELTALVKARWDTIRGRIGAIALGAEAMDKVLAAAGAPRTPSDLGWPDSLLLDAMVHGREIRNRYTFLDFSEQIAD